MILSLRSPHSYCLVHATHCLNYCTAQYTLLLRVSVHTARFSWWEAQINCGSVLWSIMVYYGLLRSLNVSMTLKVYYARYVAYITESTMQRYCACPSVCLPVLSSFFLTSMRPLRRTSQVTRQRAPDGTRRECRQRTFQPFCATVNYLFSKFSEVRYDTRCYFNVRSKADMSA